MKEKLKSLLRKVYLEGVAKELFQFFHRVSWNFKRHFGRVDRKIVDEYLSKNTSRKLHIGCGDNVREGWLNADYFPTNPDILHLDATHTFPFRDNEFDYVFSEHMIEHVSYSQGEKMLSESYRVLRPGGKLRISTPDMAFLVGLYGSSKSDVQNKYIRWATDRFIKSAPFYGDVFVINNFVRNWGHQFIYDESSLRASIEKVGFSTIIRCELNDSADDALRCLENEKRMPEGFLKLESITFEATKADSRTTP